MAWLVMCNLTQQELGRFASRDEALESPEWESSPEPFLFEGEGDVPSSAKEDWADGQNLNGGGHGADGALMTALFGCKQPPTQYDRYAKAGATIAPEQVTAALATIKADAPVKKGRTPTARDLALRAAADERREKARAELAARDKEWAEINAAAWAAAGKEQS